MTGVICPGGKGLGGTCLISPPNSYMDRKHEVPGSKGGFTARWQFQAVNDPDYASYDPYA